MITKWKVELSYVIFCFLIIITQRGQTQMQKIHLIIKELTCNYLISGTVFTKLLLLVTYKKA